MSSLLIQPVSIPHTMIVTVLQPEFLYDAKSKEQNAVAEGLELTVLCMAKIKIL